MTNALPALIEVNGHIQTQSFLELIALRLCNDESLIRYRTAKMLILTGEKSCTEEVFQTLLRMINDDDPYCSTAATEALGTFRTNTANRKVIEFILHLIVDDNGNSAIPQALGQLCADTWETEVTMQTQYLHESEDWKVRATIAEALGWVADKNASLSIISEMLKCVEDSDSSVRTATAQHRAIQRLSKH